MDHFSLMVPSFQYQEKEKLPDSYFCFFYLEQGNRDWEEEVVLCHL